MTQMGNRVSEIGNREWENGAPNFEPSVPRYQQLEAWRHADDLAVEVYHLTKKLPWDARELRGQLIRAGTSAPANIAEGYGRPSSKEFLQFLVIARSSLYEVHYFLHFLKRIEVIDQDTHKRLSAECERAVRIMYGLMRSVHARTNTSKNGRRYLKEQDKK